MTKVHRRVNFKRKPQRKRNILREAKERPATDKKLTRDFQNSLTSKTFFGETLENVRYSLDLTFVKYDKTEEMYERQKFTEYKFQTLWCFRKSGKKNLSKGLF